MESETIRLVLETIGAAGVEDLRKKLDDLKVEGGELSAAFGRGEIELKEYEAEIKRTASSVKSLEGTLAAMESAQKQEAATAARVAADRAASVSRFLADADKKQAAANKAVIDAEREAAAQERLALKTAATVAASKNYSQNITALGYSLNDFFSVQGGIDQRLNAIANNLPMLLAGFGGLGLALSGIVPIIGIVIRNWDTLREKFGFGTEEMIGGLDKLKARAKELESIKVKLAVDTLELANVHAEIEKIESAVQAFNRLHKSQASTEKESGAEVEKAMVEGTTDAAGKPVRGPEVAAKMRAEMVRELTLKDGRIAENEQKMADLLASIQEYEKVAALMRKEGGAGSDAQVISLIEKLEAEFTKAQEAAKAARIAIDDPENGMAKKLAGAMLDKATKESGDKLVAGQKELAAFLARPGVGLGELGKKVGTLTPDAIEKSRDFEQKQKDAIATITKAGTADTFAKNLADQAQAKGLSPEDSLKFIKEGLEEGFAAEMKNRGVVAPKGADATKEGKAAAKELATVILQIADRALDGAARDKDKQAADARRREVEAMARGGELDKAADELAKAAKAGGAADPEAFVAVRDGLARMVEDRLQAAGLGGAGAGGIAVNAAEGAADRALNRVDQQGKAAGKAADKAGDDELQRASKALDEEVHSIKDRLGQPLEQLYRDRSKGNAAILESGGPVARNRNEERAFHARGGLPGVDFALPQGVLEARMQEQFAREFQRRGASGPASHLAAREITREGDKQGERERAANEVGRVLQRPQGRVAPGRAGNAADPVIGLQKQGIGVVGKLNAEGARHGQEINALGQMMNKINQDVNARQRTALRRGGR